MFPTFRDWIIPPYYYNQKKLEFTISSVEQNIYNLFTNFFPNNVIVYGYIVIWILIGLLSVFLAFNNINKIINTANPISKSIIAVYSFFYIFNIWTIERLLMGQIHVLRGHFLFPLSVYLILKTYNQTDYKNILKLSGILFIIGFISIHHLYFLVIIALGYLLINFILHLKKNIFPKYSSILLTISSFVPSLIYLFYRVFFLDKQQYLSQVSVVDKQQIISNFSLRINNYIGSNNIFVSGVLGSGSWMIETFYELFDTRDYLGLFRFIIPYFNPLLGYIFSGLLILSIIWFFSNFKNNKFEFKFFGILSIISLILSFGYSIVIFKPVNYLFFLTPFSYLLRESGKWYSVFLLSLVFIFMSLNKDFLGRALVVIVSLYTLSNVIFTASIVPNLNFNQYPQVLTDVNKYCKDNNIKKSIYLPNQTYIQSEFSGDIFIENYWYMGTDCGFIKSNFSTVGDNSTIINSSQFDQEVNGIISDFNCENNNLINFLKRNNIELIAIDTTYYPDLLKLKECVAERYKELFDDVGILVFDARWGDL